MLSRQSRFGVCFYHKRIRLTSTKRDSRVSLHSIGQNGSRYFQTSSPQLGMSYESSRSDLTFDGSTIGTLFDKQVEKNPDRDMVVFSRDNIRYTYRQFKAKMDELTAGLLSLGLKPGDRVGIWSPNRAEWVLTQLATAKVGLILVNVNPAYRVNELDYAIQKVEMKAMVMAESFKTQDYYEMMFELFPELATCPPGKLKSSRAPALTTVIMMGKTKKPGTLLFDEVCSMGTKEHRLKMENIAEKLHFDLPVNIQFTSGTTGNPKGATLTHHNIVNNSRFIGNRMEYHKNPTIICVPPPLYHSFGMVWGSMMSVVYGVTCVFPAPSFEPEACLQSINAEKCNILYGTPTMYIDILNHPNFAQYDISSLESGVVGGSPCPVEIMKQVNDRLHMPRVCVTYGSTETSPITFLTFPDDPIEKRCGSIGCLLDHTEAKIIDETGQILPRGENGELCTRGYSTMLGYWGDKEKTEAAISPSRWYHTGDIGQMDEDGYVMINGRIKDMIIRGGENIYPVEIEQFLYTHEAIEDVQVAKIIDEAGQILPRGENGELCTRGYSTMLGYWGDKEKTEAAISPSRWYHTGISTEVKDSIIRGDLIIRGGENIYPVEIEQFLYTHEAIEDVQVVGVPDKRMGEEVCACIRVKEGMSLTEQELKDFCKGQIPHYNIPRYVAVMEAFPLTVTGKVQKSIMRKQLPKLLGLEKETS